LRPQLQTKQRKYCARCGEAEPSEEAAVQYAEWVLEDINRRGGYEF
jgi:hypothetical protein